MKLGFFTLRRKLLGSFLICMVIPALLVSIIAYEVAADKIEAELMSGAQSSITAADMITTQTISTKVKDIEFYASTLSTEMASNPEESVLLHELQLYLSTHAEVTNIFVGTKDGSWCEVWSVTPRSPMIREKEPGTRTPWTSPVRR